MSPYRVVVGDDFYMHHPEYTERLFILIAMLSVDRFRTRKIFITRKTVPVDVSDDQFCDIVARLKSSKKNSVYLDEYNLLSSGVEESGYKYVVYHKSTNRLFSPAFKTQKECLHVAMQDFCNRYNYTILKSL